MPTTLRVLFTVVFLFRISIPSVFPAEIKYPARTSSTLSAEPKENHRFLSPLDKNRISLPESAQKTLLRFLQAKKTGSVDYDLNRNGFIEKQDLFLLADRWPEIGSVIASITQLDWKFNRGAWSVDGEAVSGFADLDARMIAQEPFPTVMEFSAQFTLQEGTSAGLLFWADASGEIGYTARLDSSLNALVLAKLGPWPEEVRLDEFPWNALDGAAVHLRIVTRAWQIQVFCPDRSAYPILEANHATPLGNYLGAYIHDARATFANLSIRQPLVTEIAAPSIPQAGDYFHIYDQSVPNDWWYINDHCFARGGDGLWHLFGITHSYPPAPVDEDQFAHATFASLTQPSWQKQPFALVTDTSAGENHLWAPHVIEKDGLYYMFYAAGSLLSNYRYRMHLAFSSDLFTWTRYDGNPLFQDYFDARDPMVIRADQQYIMYYTAVAARPDGNHIVAYRTSDDLLHWSPRHTAFIHDTTGTYNGPTESPFVVEYENHFYLLIGPDGDYRRTAVYRSSTPYHWDRSDFVAEIHSHAAEVIQDTDGLWYVSHCGWYYDGVYLAPLTWKPEPKVRFFCDLGESLDCVSESEGAFISDWRGTSALDIVADYDAYFTLELPVSDASNPIILEFEEQGEVLLEMINAESTILLLNEGNTGPAFPTIHTISIQPEWIQQNRLTLRFRDADPTDGWGPNVNWVRLIY
jgi:hypothetical protein